jgi:iron(II)-dependent oxidoreductase
VVVKELAVAQLSAVRSRSLDLLAPLAEPDLLCQHSPLMSPLVWDLAHVGNYEELWLARAAGGLEALEPSLDHLYDAFRHPRANRPSLPLLNPAEARRYIGLVRDRALSVVDAVEFDPEVPLFAGGFVVGLCVQHEHQHDETMLATLQLMDGDGYRPLVASAFGSPVVVVSPGEVLVPGGPFVMGTDDEPWAYDNERPAHVVDLPPFWIDAFPVTNGQYVEFIEDGGYSRPSWWTTDGWAWRKSAELEQPGFWRREAAGSWSRLRFGWREDLRLDEPVQHVCWYEADAYARWAGKRLPTEAEWERAAAGAGAVAGAGARAGAGTGARAVAGAGAGRGLSRVESGPLWGTSFDNEPRLRAASLEQRAANLGGGLFRPAPIGTYPDGASWCGAQQMIGDVWEWTSSDFGGYPGFASFPYPEYSEVFFGSEYKVLRGGSWATDPSMARVTFRNWDYPIRRQIFAGFRCARDA